MLQPHTHTYIYSFRVSFSCFFCAARVRNTLSHRLVSNAFSPQQFRLDIEGIFLMNSWQNRSRREQALKVLWPCMRRACFAKLSQFSLGHLIIHSGCGIAFDVASLQQALLTLDYFAAFGDKHSGKEVLNGIASGGTSTIVFQLCSCERKVRVVHRLHCCTLLEKQTHGSNMCLNFFLFTTYIFCILH